MSILGIVLHPHHYLDTKVEPVEKFTDEHAKLAADMLETIDAHKRGVGLAANQCLQLTRVIAWRFPKTTGKPRAIVNPVIIYTSGEAVEQESSLSALHLDAWVKRAATITVVGLDGMNGEEVTRTCMGMEARIVQHLIDTLDGVWFKDAAGSNARQIINDDKTGRNDPCHCGSGLKFKKCCG